MKKRFNITGPCIPEEHYMVDISTKISGIFSLIEQRDYFVINRPRQYGKTTTIYMPDRSLKVKLRSDAKQSSTSQRRIPVDFRFEKGVFSTRQMGDFRQRE